MSSDGEAALHHWQPAGGGYWPDSNWQSFASGPAVWTNNSGEDYFLIKTAPYRGPWNGVINSGNQWTISVESSAPGEDGPNCLARELSEADVPNRAEPGSCGAQPLAADPVNVVLGNFWQSWSDVSIPGRGPMLDLART